jgi:hypothetical protein
MSKQAVKDAIYIVLLLYNNMKATKVIPEIWYKMQYCVIKVIDYKYKRTAKSNSC